jgi:hypothetical protein
MFDDKLKRARQLIEKRDQIDEELRALFGEAPQPKRSRRQLRKENGSGFEPEKEAGAPALEAHQ